MIIGDAPEEMDAKEPFHRTHEVDRNLSSEEMLELGLDLIGSREVDKIINIESHEEGDLRRSIRRIGGIANKPREDAGVVRVGCQAARTEDAGDLVVPMLRSSCPR